MTAHNPQRPEGPLLAFPRLSITPHLQVEPQKGYSYENREAEITACSAGTTRMVPPMLYPDCAL